jgi:hypothetical protein
MTVAVAETETDTPAWTAERVTQALFHHFANASWAVVYEITEPSGRRIDVLLARKARRMGIGHIELLAVEVKVSRADFLSDVRRPEKQGPWREIAHRHAYAVPDGLVTKDEVPEGCGLIVLGRNKYQPRVAEVRWAKRAPYTPTSTAIPSWLFTTLAYRASWAEARLKGWSGVHTYGTDGDTVEDLRGKLDAAKKEIDRLSNRVTKVTDERDAWRGAFATAGGLPCQFCGQLLKPGRVGRSGYFDKWVHVKKDHNEVCEIAREAKARDEAKARWESQTDTEKEEQLARRDYGRGRPEPEQIIREWSYPDPARPSDDLLPEGVTNQ